jgi:hypothetical protein
MICHSTLVRYNSSRESPICQKGEVALQSLLLSCVPYDINMDLFRHL